MRDYRRMSFEPITVDDVAGDYKVARDADACR